MTKVLRVLVVLSISLAAGGCASITGTTGQSVSVQTMEKSGKEVTGAACELTNNKGKWFVASPGSVGITRSNDDLQVLCNKDGFEPGRAAVVSATKGQMFGNIIFGGGIGAIVDHNTGAAYEYPAFFQVMMGGFTKIELPKAPENQPEGNQSPTNAASFSTAPVVVNSVQPVAFAPQTSKEEKLRELKRLNDAGLIGQDVYLDQQRKVLEEK